MSSKRSPIVFCRGKKPDVLDDEVDLGPALVLHGRGKAATRGELSKQEGH